MSEHKPAYALVVRCGSGTYIKPDGSIGTAGKGALVQTDVCCTISTSVGYITIFQPEKNRP